MSRKNKQELMIASNYQMYLYWRNRIIRLAQSCVHWKGLPKEIDSVMFERILTVTGSAIFCYDDVLNVYSVGTNASTGNLDIYGIPLNRKVVYRNGLSANFDPETSTVIYNNSQRSSDLWMYDIIAKRMANIDCAVDINVNSQKTMPIIPTSQVQQLTITNLYNSLISNSPYTLVDPNSMDVEAFKNALTFDNRKSFTSDLMIQVQKEIWNKALTLIGVNNVNIDKRERVNTHEVDSNLDEILIMRRDRLNSRELACEEINRKFDLNLSVSYYSDEGGLMQNGEFYSALTDDLRIEGGTGESRSGDGVSGQGDGDRQNSGPNVE